MKNLLFLFFISFASNLYGQNDFSGNTAQGGNITFNCSQKSGNTVIVYNQQIGILPLDTSSKGNSCLKAFLTTEAYNKIYTIARQVFSQTRANELSLEKSIRFYLNITHQGEIIGIVYRLYNNTPIIPTELANLETLLKQANFPLKNGNVCTQVQYLPYQGQIHFNKLYQ